MEDKLNIFWAFEISQNLSSNFPMLFLHALLKIGEDRKLEMKC